MAQLTQSSLLEGALALYQPDTGYRFNVDSLLLANFVLAHEPSGGTFTELGAGCGVVSLLLARGGQRAGVALELQEEFIPFCSATLAANQCLGVRTMSGDLRKVSEHLTAASSDFVVSNPPYFRSGGGIVSQVRMDAVARHEVECTMDDLLSAMRYLLAPGGRAYVVYPAFRFVELAVRLERHKLCLDVLQWVHPLPEKPAGHFLARMVKSGKRDPAVLQPLFTAEESGDYTAWYAALRNRIVAKKE